MICRQCDGRGELAGGQRRLCLDCQGTGQLHGPRPEQPARPRPWERRAAAAAPWSEWFDLGGEAGSA